MKPRTSAPFAVVPPMSNDSRSGNPSLRPWWADMRAPAAGPDSSARTGKRRAVSGMIEAPDEVITNSRPPKPRFASPRSSLSM